ncbi:hypothetical protein BJ165DRAFT_1400802 [Panaeolus papilionaceus]|nr:hypothetical protein BJ165DRAFT_1400802 [Panaeolus papilionaceus]
MLPNLARLKKLQLYLMIWRAELKALVRDLCLPSSHKDHYNSLLAFNRWKAQYILVWARSSKLSSRGLQFEFHRIHSISHHSTCYRKIHGYLLGIGTLVQTAVLLQNVLVDILLIAGVKTTDSSSLEALAEDLEEERALKCRQQLVGQGRVRVANLVMVSLISWTFGHQVQVVTAQMPTFHFWSDRIVFFSWEETSKSLKMSDLDLTDSQNLTQSEVEDKNGNDLDSLAPMSRHGNLQLITWTWRSSYAKQKSCYST